MLSTAVVTPQVRKSRRDRQPAYRGSRDSRAMSETKPTSNNQRRAFWTTTFRETLRLTDDVNPAGHISAIRDLAENLDTTSIDENPDAAAESTPAADASSRFSLSS